MEENILNEFKYEFDINNDNKNKCLAKLEQAIKHLKDLNEPSIIMSKHSSYEAIFYITKVISYKSDLIDFSLFTRLNCENMFGDLLLYLYESNKSYDFRKHKIAINEPNKKCDQNERYISILFYLLDIISIIMCESNHFRYQFQLSNGLKSLINFIKDKEFVKKNLKTTITGFFTNKFNIIDFIVSNINLASKKCVIHKTWFDLNAIDVLIDISKTKSSCIDLAYSSIINICNDKDLIELNYVLNNYLIKDLIQKLKLMSNDFRLNQFNRNSLIVDGEIDGKNEIEIHFIVQNDLNASSATACWFIFDGLTKLAVNLNLANKIYFDYAIKEILKTILANANQYEKILVLKLLVQLTFNRNVAKELSKDDDFVNNKLNVILKKCELVTTENVIIKYYCEILKWNMNEKEETASIINNQIYLSFTNKNKELISKLKDLFEMDNTFKTVTASFSSNKMTNLNQTLENIKTSNYVILLIDETYRSNFLSQIECNYSFLIKKPIIPIVLKDDFEEIDERFGWIGNITKNMRKIKYAETESDSCEELVKKIFDQIDLFKNLTKQVVILDMPNENRVQKLEIMSYDEVIQWLKSRKDLDDKIIESLDKLKCDGKVLRQLWDMKNTTPEFFDQSFTKINDLDSNSISKLFNELDLLFIDKKAL
jgi:hypothetical protein